MQGMLATAVGVGVGLMLAPKALNALNIPSEQGFGMDDVVTIGVVLAGIFVAKKFLPH
jgi:hypothetical protein